MHFGISLMSDISAADISKAERLLSAEQSRHLAVKNLDKRRQSLAARALLMTALESHGYGVSLTELAAYDNGRPYFKGNDRVFVSLTHSGDRVGYALSSSPVGVDIERIRSVSEKLIARVCTVEEKEYVNSHGISAFFVLWALKEAYIKAADSSFSKVTKISFVKNGNIAPPSAEITIRHGVTEGYAWAVIEKNGVIR